MIVSYKKPFIQLVKKVNRPLQLAIEDAVKVVCANPKLGEGKSGDLLGIYVYKFRFNRQEYLMAYSYEELEGVTTLAWIDFYRAGSHENFYLDLKRFLRQQGGLVKAKKGGGK